jgi:uncharacterized protein (TIGR02594 family)
MRSRTGVVFALVCIPPLLIGHPAAARPTAPASAHQQHKHKSKPKPVVAPVRQSAASAPRSTFVTARALFSSVRSNAMPALVAEARKYIGTNPTDRKRLWCARFMNYVLAKLGYEGTNSDAAKSFAYYGKRISEPQVGAIAVLTRGRKGGHVGVVSGVDAKGDPIIISGNHTPSGVGEGVYARSRVIAYVVPIEQRAIARGGASRPASEPNISSPIAELLAAINAEASAPAPARVQPAQLQPARLHALRQVVRRPAQPVAPHRTVQQTPDQRASRGVRDPLSGLMGSIERAPAPQRRVM